MEAAGVAGDRQDEGQGVEVDHVISHIEELCIQTCRDTGPQPEVSTLKKWTDRKRQTSMEEGNSVVCARFPLQGERAHTTSVST